jgi:hypothetical protein
MKASISMPVQLSPEALKLLVEHFTNVGCQLNEAVRLGFTLSSRLTALSSAHLTPQSPPSEWLKHLNTVSPEIGPLELIGLFQLHSRLASLQSSFRSLSRCLSHILKQEIH